MSPGAAAQCEYLVTHAVHGVQAPIHFYKKRTSLLLAHLFRNFLAVFCLLSFAHVFLLPKNI